MCNKTTNTNCPKCNSIRGRYGRGIFYFFNMMMDCIDYAVEGSLLDCAKKYLLTPPLICTRCSIVFFHNAEYCMVSSSQPSDSLIYRINTGMIDIADKIFITYKDNKTSRQEFVYFVNNNLFYYIPSSWIIHLYDLCNNQGVLYKITTEMRYYLFISTGNFKDGIQTVIDNNMLLKFFRFITSDLIAVTSMGQQLPPDRKYWTHHPMSVYACQLDYIRGCKSFTISKDETKYFLEILSIMMPYLKCATNETSEYNKFLHTPIQNITNQITKIPQKISEIVNTVIDGNTTDFKICHSRCIKCIRNAYIADSVYVNIILKGLNIYLSFTRLWFYIFLHNYMNYIICNTIDVCKFDKHSSMKTYIFNLK